LARLQCIYSITWCSLVYSTLKTGG